MYKLTYKILLYKFFTFLTMKEVDFIFLLKILVKNLVKKKKFNLQLVQTKINIQLTSS